MWSLWCGVAAAGQLFLVSEGPDGPRFDALDAISEGRPIVTYEGQPVEVVVLTDLSGSMLMDPASTFAMSDVLMALRDALAEGSTGRDQLGVTAFAGDRERWIPLGPVDRPDLGARLASFGPPNASAVDATGAVLCERDLLGLDLFGGWDLEPDLPNACALDVDETDAVGALHKALRELRSGRDTSLQAIVMLWDGGHSGRRNLYQALARANADGVHVWSVAVTDASWLPAAGGGDAYLAGDYGALVARRIVDDLRGLGQDE